MGKNVAVFVDVANIFYAAKAAGVDIDYVTLLKSATAGRDFVRAYAYTGLDPENENQRNFHQFLARHQYKVVSKDIRKYGDGRVKANLDIELVVDMMKTARNLDVAVIVSGDGDFASAIRAVQEMGVRCEVISFRGNTSSDLIEVADLFTDITQIAKVDKGSTRSGRRVADDDEDLSMTEVPEKQSEGTGRGRGRGRYRGRPERDEAPAAASRSSRGTGRAAASSTRTETTPGDAVPGLVALPGERLSRATRVVSAEPATDAPGDAPDELEELDGDGQEQQGEGGEGRRRRRRRGGRGRGRGHRDGLDAGIAEGGEAGETDAVGAAGESPDAVEADEAATPEPTQRAPRTRRAAASGDLPTPFDVLDEPAPSRPAPRSTPFGSVWDRQLGTPTARPAASSLPPLPEDDEDFDEPEIPEYLIAEQRRGAQGRGAQGRGGGGRGGARGAYAAAMDRERFGGGRGAGVNRFAEPPRRGGGGGGGGRGAQQPPRGPRSDRPERFDRAPRTGGGSEPWSEVPPELEELLRAQLSTRRPAATTETATPAAAPEATAEAEAPKRRTTRRTTPAAAPEATAEAEAPKRRTTRRPAATTETATPAAAPEATAEAEAPKRRTTRRTTPAAAPEATAEAEAPKRRTTRRPAATTETATPAAAPEATAEAEAPKRRTTRRKTAEPAEG